MRRPASSWKEFMYAAGARVSPCAHWTGAQWRSTRSRAVPSSQQAPDAPLRKPVTRTGAAAQAGAASARRRLLRRGAHAAEAGATPRELWRFAALGTPRVGCSTRLAALEAPRSGAAPGALGAARASGMEPPAASPERRSPGSFPATEARRTPQSELVFLAEAPPSWLCSICRDAVPHEPVVTPCGHSFCRTCLTKALGATSGDAGSAVRSRCPMCRALVPSADAVRPNERARPAPLRAALRCVSPAVAAADAVVRPRVLLPRQRFARSWRATRWRAPTRGAAPHPCALATGACTRTSAASARCSARKARTAARGAACGGTCKSTWRCAHAPAHHLGGPTEPRVR